MMTCLIRNTNQSFTLVPSNFSLVIRSKHSTISVVKWFFQSPALPLLKYTSFARIRVGEAASVPILFTSKLLKFSKLHNLIILCTTPSWSSSKEKGCPMNSASVLTWTIGSVCRSSYLNNSTLWGHSNLAFQYPKTWSQYGPCPENRLAKCSNATS